MENNFLSNTESDSVFDRKKAEQFEIVRLFYLKNLFYLIVALNVLEPAFSLPSILNLEWYFPVGKSLKV